MRTNCALFALTAMTAAFAFQSSALAVAPESELSNKGAALLREHCSRCHAIGKTDTSSHAQAPAFRDVFLRYPAETLAESLAEGIESGYPDMPVLAFEIEDIEAIIAYFKTLNGPAAAP